MVWSCPMFWNQICSLKKKNILVFKNNTCCTRQNSAWQCCMCNLSCTLVAICSWRNSKFFKAFLDNSGTAVNIGNNFNWRNTEVSKLYHYALCTQERLGLLSTTLKMRTAKILYKVWYHNVIWCNYMISYSFTHLIAFLSDDTAQSSDDFVISFQYTPAQEKLCPGKQ